LLLFAAAIVSFALIGGDAVRLVDYLRTTPFAHAEEPADDDKKPDKKKDSDDKEPLLLLDDDPPLLLDDDPPLLLDDDDGDKGKPTAAMVDNERCFVCHLDYKLEELALDHAKAKISCAECHGNCDKHIADESWASGGNGTPPEIMYRPKEINPACFKCHEQDDLDPDEHDEFLAGKTKEKVCTDCHGKHRMPKRKCKWK